MPKKIPKVTVLGASNARRIEIKINDKVIYSKINPADPIVIYKEEEKK